MFVLFTQNVYNTVSIAHTLVDRSVLIDDTYQYTKYMTEDL